MLALRPGVAAFARASYAAELRGDRTRARTLPGVRPRRRLHPRRPRLHPPLPGRAGPAPGRPRRRRPAGTPRRCEAQPRLHPRPRRPGRRRRPGRPPDRGARPSTTAWSQRLPLPQYLIEQGETRLKAGLAADWSLLRAQRTLLEEAGVRDDLTWAEFEADHGDPARAVRHARAEYARNPNLIAADALAWALYKAGRPKAALPPRRAGHRDRLAQPTRPPSPSRDTSAPSAALPAPARLPASTRTYPPWRGPHETAPPHPARRPDLLPLRERPTHRPGPVPIPRHVRDRCGIRSPARQLHRQPLQRPARLRRPRAQPRRGGPGRTADPAGRTRRGQHVRGPHLYGAGHRAEPQGGRQGGALEGGPISPRLRARPGRPPDQPPDLRAGRRDPRDRHRDVHRRLRAGSDRLARDHRHRRRRPPGPLVGARHQRERRTPPLPRRPPVRRPRPAHRHLRHQPPPRRPRRHRRAWPSDGTDFGEAGVGISVIPVGGPIGDAFAALDRLFTGLDRRGRSDRAAGAAGARPGGGARRGARAHPRARQDHHGRVPGGPPRPPA